MAGQFRKAVMRYQTSTKFC